MYKFFVDKNNISSDVATDKATATIQGDDVKHIYKVLRLEVGDLISINNCEGIEYLGKISDINKKSVEVEILEKLSFSNESPIDMYLFQGLPKSVKMDLIAQKATELGVKEITPVITERVIVKTELSEFKKVDRWNRIALEACKQSKRSLIPKINTPMEFETLVETLKNMDLIVVPYENAENFGIKKMCTLIDKSKIKKVGIVIGPEGGFEEKEIDTFKKLGAYIVTLGTRILRTETAGFVAVSLLMYELSDIGGNI